jgi:uncharacterized lipoprotein YmbA
VRRRNAGAPRRTLEACGSAGWKPAFLLPFFLLLASCSFFSRAKSTIYSIEPLPGTVVNVRGVPVGIDSVELPPGFDRREVIVRKPDHQLDVRGTEQWSGSLQTMVIHTLAFDLASRLPQGMVILPGAPKPATMRPIDLAFEEIAAGPDPKVVLDVRWNLTHRERIEVPIPSLGSKDVATGMSQALAALADRIAAGL